MDMYTLCLLIIGLNTVISSNTVEPVLKDHAIGYKVWSLKAGLW